MPARPHARRTDAARSHIILSGVVFAYDAGEPVLEDVDLHLAPGWTGVVGANGAGKSTLLGLITGALVPTAGTVVRNPDDLLVRTCAQRVDAPDDDVLALVGSYEPRDLRWRSRLDVTGDGLGAEALRERWPSLSPGERKRWQVAAALAADPDVLVLDEPTNHLDARTRGFLLGALAGFRGIGLIVTHDRESLDGLVTTTVRVHRGHATAYPGGYADAQRAWLAAEAARRDARDVAVAARDRAARRLDEARRHAAAADRQISAGVRMKGPKDGDARGILATGKAEMGAAAHGRAATLRRRDLDAASAAVDAIVVAKERGGDVFVDWEPPPRRWLASLDDVPLVAGGHVLAASVKVAVARDSRIHVAGDNGAGKSTLLAALRAVTSLPPERILWLPQELDADAGAALAREIAGLSPAVRGRVGQLAAALGLDPARALASAQPSPGEARKLAIALGLARHVWLVVLDEPTNHLDLPAIERLEEALASYPGALVIATHDHALAARLTTSTWLVAGGAVRID